LTAGPSPIPEALESPSHASSRESGEAPASSATAHEQAQPAGEREPRDDGAWDDEAGTGRSFLYKELVISGLYSPEGVTGIPPNDRSEDHFELSPRPPGSYIGLDYVKTFTGASPVNKVLPDWLSVSAINLHPRLLYDRMEDGDGLHPLEFTAQDLWVRFHPGEVDRLTLRVGQFVIPYGVNPIQAPRQRFLLPLEASDLGLKWDWGLDLKGPLGSHDWEIAATIGSGEGLHSPHLFGGSKRSSHLITGRLGAPTYWDFQYGFSFLYGDLPVIRGPNVFSDAAISRWRTGFDTFHRFGTYLMAGAQLTFGQDGFDGDEELVGITGGKTADVLGSRAWVDWVVPTHQDLRLAAQFESVNRDLSTSDSDDTAVILEVGYSFTTAISAMLDYREEFNRSMGEESDAIFLTFIYYGR
jgi:hypothetical protein